MAELEAVGCEGCGRMIWTAPGVEARCSRCDVLSAAELAFLAALGRPARARDVERSREAWERQNVVWLHGFEEGKAVWRPGRPQPVGGGDNLNSSSTPPTPGETAPALELDGTHGADCGVWLDGLCDCNLIAPEFPEWL